MSDHLEHITKETGHVRQSPRAEVRTATIAYLTPLLRPALRGETVNLTGTAWHLAAPEQADTLHADLWHGSADGPAHIVQTVQRVDPLRLEVSVRRLLELGNLVAANEAGDLERCIAWTWIELDD